jgi:hypothetical protein
MSRNRIPYSLVGRYQISEEPAIPILRAGPFFTLMIEATSSFEKLEPIYQVTQHYIPEDHDLHIHCPYVCTISLMTITNELLGLNT